MIKNTHLDFWIQNNYNVLFVGKPGVGKTSIVKAAFERANLNWKYFSASTMDPWVDLVGVPREKIDENGNTYLDLLRPKEFQDDTIEAIFLDEYNRSHKKVRNAVMELIQFKSINGKKFNKLRIVWAAINPLDEDNESYDIEPLDPAQEDRFHIKVNIPYAPDVKYFADKYGKKNAKSAVEWWKDLPKQTQNQVSPRRLDYALDIYTKGGDLNYVLPLNSNVSKLVQGLMNGPMYDRLQELLVAGDKERAEAFIKVENNYTSAINFILKNRDFMTFFLPVMEEEKLANLLSNYKKHKGDLIEYVISETRNHDLFKQVVTNILKSKGNKELISKLLEEIGNYNLEEDYGIVSISNGLNTYERMKVLLKIQKKIEAKIKDPLTTEKELEKDLLIIDSILKRTQKGTVKYKKFINKMVEDCIDRLSYKNDKVKLEQMFPNICDKCQIRK